MQPGGVIRTQYALLPCRGCGRRHRSEQTRARCALPPARWVSGEGHHAVVSCTGLTVSLWSREEEAARVAERLDAMGCGHRCTRTHRVLNLTAAAA